MQSTVCLCMYISKHTNLPGCSDLLTLIKDADLSIEERATKATFYHKVRSAHLTAGLLLEM